MVDWCYHFRRAPERSRRNQRPHVSATKTPTAHGIARLVSHPFGMRMQTIGGDGGSLATALPEIAGQRSADGNEGD